MPLPFKHLATATANLVFSVAAWAQTGTEAGRPPAVIPLASEPAPKLLTFPPLADCCHGGHIVVKRDARL
ncbi:DUF6130 family protein [Massilia polaris]|uniref:DUF6130 family protein n=1 Tax=Massilia polaris TaxID=2728846 RepID=UPI00351D2F16